MRKKIPSCINSAFKLFEGQKISKTNYLVLISSTKRTDSAQAHYSFSGGYENKLLICSWDFLNFRVCTTIFFMKFWGLSIKKPYPEENFGFEPQVTLLLKNQRSSGTIHLTFLSSSIAYTLSLFFTCSGLRNLIIEIMQNILWNRLISGK